MRDNILYSRQWCWFLTFVLIIDLNDSWRHIKVPIINVSLTFVLQILYAMLSLMLLGKKARKQNVFSMWSVIFLIYTLFGFLWCISSQNIVDALKGLIPLFLFLSSVSLGLKDTNDIEKTLFSLYIALCCSCFYILLFVNVFSLQGRIGQTLAGLEQWNANDIGFKMSVGCGLALYFFDKRKTKRRIYHLILMVIFFVIVLLSGSRTSLALLLMIIAGYMWVKTKGAKKISLLIIGVVSFVMLYYLITSVPLLYDIIGSRIERFFINSFGKQHVYDFSMETRKKMISYGMMLFAERPIIGYGLSNYKFLFGNYTGWYTYSHNNFMEILISGGIIGFSIYYSIYIYIIRGLWAPAFKSRDKLACSLLVINIASLVSHYGTVTYLDVLFNIFPMLAVVYIGYNKRSLKNEM